MAALARERNNTNSIHWQDRLVILRELGPIIVQRLNYAFLYVTSSDGIIVYSTREEMIGNDVSRSEYIQDALQNRISWSPLYYSTIANEPCLVLSAPIREKGQVGEVVGALNLALSQLHIQEIVHDGLHALGQRVDAYLVDSAGLLLTNTLLGEYREGAILNERIRSRPKEVLSTPIQRADLSFSRADEYLDYLGNPVLGQMEVSTLGNRPVGLVIEMDVKEAFEGIHALRNIMVLFGFLILCCIGPISFWIARSFANSIVSLAGLAKKVAKGDLTVNSKLERGDEIGALASSFNTMTDNLLKMVKAIRKSAESTASSSQELTSSTEETTASIEEVTASVGEFAMTIENMSKNAQDMSVSTESVHNLAIDGLQQMEKTDKQMSEIIEAAREAGATIKGLEKSSAAIENITGVILNVADQTNLLALNAAIEAARAGEHGQGFAVVADEVRKLAEETQKSVGQIKEIVSNLTSITENTVSVIENNNEEISLGAKDLQKTMTTFQSIVEKIGAVTSIVQDVASASQELAASSEEISASSEEQSASMEEISSSAEQLSAMAEELTQLVAEISL